jgi:hypothetical protein
MSKALTRMFAYLTLGVYLVVGTVAVRAFLPSETTVKISISALQLLGPTNIVKSKEEFLSIPELAFKEISLPQKRVISKRNAPRATEIVKLSQIDVRKYELNFKEAFFVSPVRAMSNLETRLAALYRPFIYQAELVAKAQAVAPVEDVVSTKQASTLEEPEFFNYDEKVLETTIEDSKVVQGPSNENEQAVASEVINNVDNSQIVESDKEEEVAITELIAFDYSKAKADATKQQLPKVSVVTTQKSNPVASLALQMVEETKSPSKKMTTQPKIPKQEKEQNAFVTERESRQYPSRLTIQVSGTDLNKTEELVGFEVRPQDDLSESVSDYNSGNVTIDENLAQPTMTRSVAILKRGFVPTNTDLILEEGSAEVTLPLLEENAFNELLAPYESRGPIGAVLVELGDDIETAALDVPYSKVLNLDENMKVTSNSNFAYQLFVGVKAGNTLLSYRKNKEISASKIIHIHEHELTYEASFYENEKTIQFSVVEEDLLGREKTPLIISSENVREFASDKTATKINDHTYKLSRSSALLGSRKYLELTHQEEPIFVGMKNNPKLVVPSEGYMRYILSKTSSGSVENQCVVQANLEKEVSRVDIGAESVSQSLELKTHFVDSDGKLYVSAGPKTEKIIIVGENHGPEKNSQDGKVNIKVEYTDGSVQYFASYCSPNTYLVEQL